MKKPLVVLTGPTAVGKTKASIGLAKAIGGEIISADSMQVYRHMDIGSAKIRPEEMQGVPHHLIDVLEPSEEFHVVRFQQMAKAAMEEIYSRGHIPMIVGGTGFYIQAVLYDIDFTENDGDDAYRQELADYADANGPLGKSIRKQRMRFTPITPRGSSGRWNSAIRRDRRYPSTMRRSGRKNRPIILFILS